MADQTLLQPDEMDTAALDELVEETLTEEVPAENIDEEEPEILSENDELSDADAPAAEPEKAEDDVNDASQSRAAYLRVIWIAMGSSVLTLILALVLTLGVLAGLNGGNLKFISPAEFGDFTAQVNTLTTQADTLEQDVAGLRSRLDNLDALSGRVGEVEQVANDVQVDMDATAAQVEEFSAELNQLTVELEPIQTQIENYQGFVENLRDMLLELFPLTEE